MPDTSQVLFRHEYEHELDTWLRRRFTYLCVTYVVLGGLRFIARGLCWLAGQVPSHDQAQRERARDDAPSRATFRRRRSQRAASVQSTGAFHLRGGCPELAG